MEREGASIVPVERGQADAASPRPSEDPRRAWVRFWPARPFLQDTLIAVVLTAASLVGMVTHFQVDIPEGGGEAAGRSLDPLGVGLILLQTLPLAWRRRTPIRVLTVTGAALFLFSLLGYFRSLAAFSGCGDDAARRSGPPEANGTASSPSGEIPTKEVTAEDFDPGHFKDSTDIDNEWFPLQPGTQFVYRGHTVEDGERIPHQVVFTVTDLTKVVNGVRAVVIWDRDFTAGELEETELAFFAQDDDGNVWHLGQYPEEYEEGKLVGAPAWIAGLEGARPGISMKVLPRLGTPSYSQGYAPAPINWVDHARVYKMGERTCVPFGCYDAVLVTEEFEPTKPDAYQLKYYARGLGNVRVGWRGSKEDEKETLVLVKVVHLDQEGLEEVRAEALELERRAYRVSRDVYGRTTPAEHSPG
jgi:hypothetical protein